MRFSLIFLNLFFMPVQSRYWVKYHDVISRSCGDTLNEIDDVVVTHSKFGICGEHISDHTISVFVVVIGEI